MALTAVEIILVVPFTRIYQIRNEREKKRQTPLIYAERRKRGERERERERTRKKTARQAKEAPYFI